MKKSENLIPHGDRTVAKICGEKWPRILSVRMAAAYTGRTSSESFRKIPEFSSLIRKGFGQDFIDKIELDNLITDMVEKQKSKTRGE